MQFTADHLHTIRGALELARDKYRDNAERLRYNADHQRLAAQFARQEEECKRTLAAMDAAEEEGAEG